MNELLLLMGRAIGVSQESTCVRRKVGAVLVDADGRVQAEGFNEERDQANCATDCPRGSLSYEQVPAGSDYRNCISLHAEMMALEAVTENLPDEDVSGWTMVVTCEPCGDCRKVLNDAGIYVVFGETL